MAVKFLSLYLLAVAGLEVVRAGTSAYSWPMCPLRSFADGMCEIAPLILDQRSVAQCNATQQNASTGLQAMSDTLTELAAQMAYVPNALPPISRELNKHI
jgi:hypothetical protein